MTSPPIPWARPLRRILLAAGALAATLAAGALPASAGDESRVRADGGKDFRLRTVLGDLDASWWWEPEPKSAGFVLVATSVEEREGWAGVVAALRARDANVLAIVVPQLVPAGAEPPKVNGPADAVLDAADYLVRQAKCDPRRIGLAGAGPAAAAVLDAGRRHGSRIAAVVCVAPDLSRFQASQILPSAAPPDGPSVLFLEHATAPDARVAGLRATMTASRRIAYDEPLPQATGASLAKSVGLLGAVPLGYRTVASFLDVRTGAPKDDVVLDGVIDEEAPPAGAWSRAQVLGATKVRTWAYRVRKRVVFGGFAPAGTKALRLDLAGVDRDDGVPSTARAEWFRRDLIDARTGRTLWTARLPIIPESMEKLDVRPEIRVVRCAQGLSFEGEWVGSSTFLGEEGRVGNVYRARVFAEDRVPPPERGDPSGDLSSMPVVPLR